MTRSLARSNEAVDSENVLSSHLEAMCVRTETAQEVIAIHDTTQFNFTGKRSGLGFTNTSTRGFLFHASLLTSAESTPVPFGVGAVQSFTRDKTKKSRSRPAQRQDSKNEGLRWLEGIRRVEPQLRRKVQIAGRGKQEGRRSESLPARDGRMARLAIAARRIKMSAPVACADGRTEPLEMNVVRVWEPNPPKGEEAIEWLLWTTEDISSKEALSKIVDIY